MKKTTTRLATTTAVLLMSAFAIILAQHDARKSANEDDHDVGQRTIPSEPPMPLAFDGWPSSSAVVRGNNDAAVLDNETEPETYDNPLRDLPAESMISDVMSTSTVDLFRPEVVTASGENPAPPSTTAALPTGSGNPTTLQPALNNLPPAFPGLDRGPSSNPLPSDTAFNQPAATADGRPSTAAPMLGAASPQLQLPSLQPTGRPSGSQINTSRSDSAVPGNFAATPIGQPTNQSPTQPNGRLGGGQGFQQLPAAPQSLPGTANIGVTNPAAGAPSSNWSQGSSLPSMSDTQRGAMVPTQLVDGALNNQPPAASTQMGNGYPSSSSSSAGFDSSRTDFAPLGPPTATSGTEVKSIPALNNPNPNASAGFSSASPQPEYPSPGNSRLNGANDTLNDTAGFGQTGRPSFNSSINNSPGSGQEILAGPGRSVSTGAINAFNSDVGNPGGPRATLASNQPGSRFLDGSQNPVMQIQKRAPEEITVGKKATFVITVRNAGNATAHDVTVVDRIPRGAKFAEASPNAAPSADGLLTWKLGEMNAGDEKIINLQIIPEAEGEVGSVASVHFAAQASVRTMATAPQLEVVADSAGPVIIGQTQQVAVTIRNTGSGVSRGVRLEADIPSQLKHESGETQLEAFIGDLRPNESKRLVLNVAAVQPGQSSCPLRAVNEDGVQAQAQFSVDVRAPQLVATISGPTRRYLERQATYQIVVNNSGTAVARNLYFDVHLPVGLKFVSADIAQATYNAETHSVTLGLAELNPGANATFTVTVLPVELGPQNIRFNATGDLGVAAEAKGQMVVEGLSELTFTIGQDNGTVETGATTTYSVQISNVGNQSDKNVQLQVQIPEGAKLLKVDAPVDFREEPGRLVFAPIGEMRSRDVKTLRFQVQHNRAGNQVIRAQLTSTNWPVAVLKEEGTLVYNDQ